MSNIGKILSFVIFICLFLPPVFAEEKQSGYGFSVTPSFSMVYGQANEIVYKNSKTSDYLSELQWDIMPLFYAGWAADFGPVDNFSKHGFVGTLSFKMGIPQITGIMEDRDWEDKSWLSSGTLTNYSRHDNFSARAILADLSLGYSFPLYNFIALGLNFDFSFMHYYWIASDGYYQYLNTGQTWVDEIVKVPVKGNVIEYEQNWFILSPGVFVKFRLGRFFSLYGDFNYSPLIFCADTDNHLLRNTIFQDNLFFGHYLKGGGGITFSPMSDVDFALFLSYSSITDSRGDSYFYSVNHTGIAGGGYYAFEFGLLARLRLFGWS
jgi:outer membrane protease